MKPWNHEPLYQKCRTRVAKLMKWEEWKVNLWFNAPNPFFGNLSPDDCFEMGLGFKVAKFITGAEEENRSLI